MTRQTTLTEVVAARFPDADDPSRPDFTAWAKAARVSVSLCRMAMRGAGPKQPLLREGMASALKLTPDAFDVLVAGQNVPRAKVRAR